MSNTSDILQLIKAIPKDTPPAELPQQLRPVLELLLDLDAPTRTAILYNDIKSYFELTNADIKAYEKQIKLITPIPINDEKSNINSKSLVPELVHWVRHSDGSIKYLLNVENKLKIQDTYILNDIEVKPKQIMGFMLPNENIIKKQYLYEPAKLLKDIEKFIYDHVEFPDDKHYIIPALWVMHTWLMESFNSTPIFYLYGVKETGKSRGGEVLTELAFRCERVTSVTEATMFREADMFHGTLVIDEIKLTGQDGNKAVCELLKSRYKRGIAVKRCNNNIVNKEDQIESFDCYGPCCLCSTEHVDDIIGSRTIKFIMGKNSRPGVENDIDKATAEQLRERLLYFRHHNLNKPLPACQSPARRRLGEITMPLYKTLLLCDPTRVQEFKDFILEIESSRKEEESDTFEAEIAKHIFAFLSTSTSGVFTSKDILTKFPVNPNDKFKHSERSIGIKIHKLGFKPIRVNNVRTWHSTPILLARIKEQYDIYDENTLFTDKTLINQVQTGEDVPF